MRRLWGCLAVLALSLALPHQGFAAWQLTNVTVMGTTYTVTLRDPTLYKAPAEGEKLPSDPMLSGEHVAMYSYDGGMDVATFEAAIKNETAKRLDNLNRQIGAKEAVQKDVTVRFQ